MILLEQLQIHPRAIVKALGKGQADHMNQIAVALLIFTQQNQMIGIGVHTMYLIMPCSSGNIHLTADNRLDTSCLCRTVKINDTIHDAMICDGNGILSDVLHMLHHVADPAGTVQQAEFGMYM